MGYERGRTISGARARLLIKGQKIGWATGIRARTAIGYQPTRVLDEIEVAEHVPNTYDVSLSFTTLTILGKSLQQLGLFPKGGPAEGDRLKEILGFEELTVVIEDNVESTPLFQILGVKIAEQNIAIDAGNLSGTDVTAVARSIKDASEL
jgi:hypothetical protein